MALQITDPKTIINETNSLLDNFYDLLLEMNDVGIKITDLIEEYNLNFEDDSTFLKKEMKRIVNSAVFDGDI